MATKLSDYLKNVTTAAGSIVDSAATSLKKTMENVAKNTGTGKTTVTGGGSLKTTVKPAGTSTAQKYSVSDTAKNIASQTSVDDIRKRLEAFSKNKPADYVGSYQENISKLAEQIANRGDFSYDPTADGLWQIYEKKYTDLGKTAMADTLGKAAAMNGGYGTSYGQMAGQQAFNQYMKELADIIPELEQRAYDRWTDEEAALLSKLAMYMGLDETEYGRYRDEVGDYYTDLGFEKDLIDTERSIYENDRNYNYQVKQDAIADALAREQFKYQKEQDAITNDLNAEKWEYEKALYDSESASDDDDEYEKISSSALTAAKKGAQKAFKTGTSTLQRVSAAVDYISGLPDEYAIYADEIANELGYSSYARMIEIIEDVDSKGEASKSADRFFYWKE